MGSLTINSNNCTLAFGKWWSNEFCQYTNENVFMELISFGTKHKYFVSIFRFCGERVICDCARSLPSMSTVNLWISKLFCHFEMGNFSGGATTISVSFACSFATLVDWLRARIQSFVVTSFFPFLLH